MASHRGSTQSHSRRSSSDSVLENLEEGGDAHEDHERLLQRATGRGSPRNTSLHDLEFMQAMSSSVGPAPASARASNTTTTAETEVSPTQAARRTNSGTLSGNLTSSAHVRYVLEEEDSSRGGASHVQLDQSTGAASIYSEGEDHSAYSEYSEYEEDEFDPEWHARQNQQAAAALLAKSGPRQSAAGLPSVTSATEKTRSISDIVSEASSSKTPQKDVANIFAKRRDLREEVDQTVNLMDASVGNYEDPREFGEWLVGSATSSNRRQPRRGRKQQSRDSITSNFFAAAQNSLVDVFLDTSDGQKVPSFRRSLSRSTNNGSLRRSGTGQAAHQRRLFYGHSPPPPPTIREGQYFYEGFLENCCKLLIVLFVLFFVLIMALPQATWWIQEKLGIIQDDGTPVFLPPTLPPISWKDQRLESLRNMITTHELTNEQDLYNPASPQYQASLWLAQDDPAELTLALSEEGLIEPHKILNRYVLATFYFAMNGPKRDKDTDQIVWNQSHWQLNEGWMTEQHVCEWHGIDCEGLNHIAHFNLTRNWLKGTIPSELSHLTDLILVDWSHNQISGTFPEWVGESWYNLEYLLLEKNDLQGSLPATVGNMTHLQELVLTHTNLAGEIPSELNHLTELRVLKLGLNAFRGTIPNLQGLSSSLEHFNVYGNFLTGAIPEQLFALTKMVGFMLDQNELEGSIPTEVGLMSRLEVFSVSKNKITGSLPDVWGNTPNLFELRVANNHIRGTIPQTIANLTELQYLTLDDNPITGTIPTEFGHLENLVAFEVYHTELAGSMPEEICSLEVRRGVDLIVFGDCDGGRFECHCCDRCY